MAKSGNFTFSKRGGGAGLRSLTAFWSNLSIAEQRSDLKVSNFIAGDFEPDFNHSLALNSARNTAKFGSTIRLHAEDNNNIVSLDEVRKFYYASADTLRFYENKEKMTAFTLAEVLITLGIIGVVAAMTLPAFISNVQDRIKAKRIENINQKLSKVTDKMAATSGLIGYPDTMAFVEEMQKHMSIAKVCDNSHLADCWGSTEVDLNKDGKTWEIAKTKTAKTLKVPNGVQNNWDNTVGIVTADGVPLIVSYDKSCNFSADKGLTYNKEAALSNSMSCLSGVMDWNGGGKPNKLGKDVVTFGVAGGLGQDCAIEASGKCFSSPFQATYSEAVEKCGGIENLPSVEDFNGIANLVYPNGWRSPIDKALAFKYGITTNTGYVDNTFWTSSYSGNYNDNSGQVDTVWFFSAYYASPIRNSNFSMKEAWISAMCISDTD